MKKIPFQNRIFAFVLSFLFAFCLILSFFALPVELVFFNPQSYYTMLEKEEYAEVIPDILSETLVYQTGSQFDQMNLVTNKDTINAILKDYLPTELVQTTFNKVVDQLLAYLNFRIPTGDMKVNISELKAALASSGQEIASDYLATFPNCQASEVEGIDFSNDLSVQDLPACKPSGKNLSRFEEIWADAFEDAFNSLPSSISLTSVLPLEGAISNRFFTYYSLVRWGFRLLPIISILLMIVIVVLLRNERNVMWRWCGRLLVIVSGLTMIGLVILLIGFDQFIAMLLNPLLTNLVTGFGYVLLGVVQDVGFQMLIWVIITAIVVMGFGAFLLLIAKIIKPATLTEEQVEPVEEIGPADLSFIEAEVSEKAIQPETLEEVEEEEKKRRKKKAGKKANKEENKEVSKEEGKEENKKESKEENMEK